MALQENVKVEYSFKGRPKSGGIGGPKAKKLRNCILMDRKCFSRVRFQIFLPPGDFTTLRALVLVTADSRVHAELGLTKAGEKYGCRRCGVEGT